MKRKINEGEQAMARAIARARALVPAASLTERTLVAIELLRLDELRSQTQAMRDAYAMQSKVLEVLLKQYSRLVHTVEESRAT